MAYSSRFRDKGLDTFHHVIMRGSRGLKIIETDTDRWDFLKLLFYLNDTFKYSQWERDLKQHQCRLFDRPTDWPEREPLVRLSAFCLHDNHFHLLVKEIREGGLSEFMQRLPNSMTKRYNKNYDGSGSIFQSSYQSRLIDSDADLMNVALYIMVKNVFERYPGGLKKAISEFNQAYKWALGDPFSSFAEYATDRRFALIDKDLLTEYFPNPKEFKNQAREYVSWRGEREESIKDFLLE
ncbi:MAG: transposase [Candidatus Paceibacterota bacterium]